MLSCTNTLICSHSVITFFNNSEGLNSIKLIYGTLKYLLNNLTDKFTLNFFKNRASIIKKNDNNKFLEKNTKNINEQR